MGGQSDALTAEMRRRFTSGLDLGGAIGIAVASLGTAGGADGAPRSLPASQLEVAVLDRTRGKRKFKRITGSTLSDLLPAASGEPAAEPAPADTPPHDANGGSSDAKGASTSSDES
jgi:proteasome alpha subunit